MDIDKIDLYDKKIISINIVSYKDFFNIINIKVEYQDDILIIQCKDCYSAKIDSNMYISGYDSIRFFSAENILIKQEISKYPQKNISIPLKKVYFNLNTSNSNIEILAKNIICYYEDGGQMIKEKYYGML